MSTFRNLIAAMLVALAMSFPAMAEDGGPHERTKTDAYDTVVEDLKNAIINRGYVIDYVGQLNKMLERTSEAVGSVTDSGAKSPYKNAQYMQFCAAKLTHEAVSANPQSIVNCPYVLYAYELNSKPGVVDVGYRPPLGGPSKRSRAAVKEIADLLTAITKEATE